MIYDCGWYISYLNYTETLIQKHYLEKNEKEDSLGIAYQDLLKV